MTKPPMPAKAIYEPKGAALEYAPLACNLWRGCWHGCLYCFVPQALRVKRERFHCSMNPRPRILEALTRDARTLAGDPRRILFCFTSDPYPPSPPDGARWTLTREALEIMVEYDLRFDVLTKGGTAACNDFDLYADGRGRFAQTIVFNSEKLREHWEPNAAPIINRIDALMEAKRQGIETWVSVEPVIDPEQGLAVVKALHRAVDGLKIGKLNHHPAANDVDWKAFCRSLADILHGTKVTEGIDTPYLIKASLEPYWPADVPMSTIEEPEPPIQPPRGQQTTLDL